MPVHVEEIRVVRGAPDSAKAQIASIYYEAFQRKLLPLFKGLSDDEATEFLVPAIRTENAFVAMRDDRVLGILGFQQGEGKFIDITWDMLVAQFGFWRAIERAFWGILLERKPPHKTDLQMDGIAVHATARGQGVGSLLFEALFAFAEEEKYERILLDVIDSNPRAKALYERLGFVAIKEERLPSFLAKRFGFSSATGMAREV
jgi:ribosomal protein S18 acetylase RimI-like enzyme